MSDTYKPGEKVPRSGIYAVMHDRAHAEKHEVTCIYGKVFPPCRGCGGGVRFRLVRHAKHIANHDLFKQ
ncbi:MAG: hypothetical protein ACRELB_12660 [Polyangiaceae bacterium]